MNLRQLFASSTPEEQFETLCHMLQTIEARKNKLIFIPPLSKSALDLGRGRGWGIIRERRGAFRGAHFLNDKRRRLTPRHVYLSTFMFVLATMSIAVWISIFHLPPTYAAPLMLAHLGALGAIVTVKPYNRKAQLALS